MNGLIMVIILLFIYFNKRKTVFNAYSGYYKEKRAQFPWLEKWISERRINPAKVRAIEDMNNSIAGFAVFYLAISLILGFILNLIVRLIVEKALSIYLMPNDWRYIFYRNIGSAVAILIAVLIVRFSAKFSDPDPAVIQSENGLPLECPSCGCPHSWVWCRTQNIVDEVMISEVKTKTTPSAASYGGGAIGQMFAGASSSTSTTTDHYYTGRVINDFTCLNCGNTQRTEKEETWKNIRPIEEKEYNPPLDSWVVAKGVKARLITAVLFAVMLIIAALSIGLIVSYSKHTKEEMINLSVRTATENTDASLNGIINTKYLSTRVLAEPSATGNEIAVIKAGEFFTIIGKDGKFTKIEYKGLQGYASSQTVQKLRKERVAVTNKKADICEQPDRSTRLRFPIYKGAQVIMLGENVDGYVKVDHDGTVYWIHARDLKW